nr:replication-relaxation family protein [Actinoplanes bogorensis]
MRVQAGLTARDLTLLSWLADHGVLTTDQIAAALFPSLNFAQRRLRALMSKQLVDRFRPQRPDGGSYPYHWVLAQLGSDVMASQRGEPTPRRDQARLRRWHLTSRANLPHLLVVNDFFTQLAARARTHPGAELERWWSAARCQQMTAFTGDDTRSGHRADGTALAYRLKVRPDGHGIFTDHGVSTAFFLEYDTGTESLNRLVDKVDGYRDLARVTGRLWPVLFWLPGPARERHLHDALSQAGTGYPTATAVHGRGGRAPATATDLGHPAGPVWWLHQHTGPALTLAELSVAITDRIRDAA